MDTPLLSSSCASSPLAIKDQRQTRRQNIQSFASINEDKIMKIYQD